MITIIFLKLIDHLADKKHDRDYHGTLYQKVNEKS